jgi:AcrR family transcriptional regulator
MAKKPVNPKSSQAPRKAAASIPEKPMDPRRKVVGALFRLAADAPYGSIGLAEIAREAGLSLADLRDLFPSKGAILGGLMRLVDREVLEGTAGDMDGEGTHDRVLDIMLRRFDALAPYKDGLRSVHRSVRADPVLALTLNQAAANSWRYMLEAAGVETQGPLGALRTQGAILVFAKAFPVWLDDEPDLARTMATLDRELKRGEGVLQWAGAVHRLTAPFRGFARAVCERRQDRRRDRDAGEETVQYG